jgi:hypothetical protein
MRNARQVLDDAFLEMRWRCLSLAADLDRVQRAADGANVLERDERLAKLRAAIEVLNSTDPDRAERIQMIFSDKTPPPSR